MYDKDNTHTDQPFAPCSALEHAVQTFCDTPSPAYWMDTKKNIVGMNTALRALMGINDNTDTATSKFTAYHVLYPQNQLSRALAAYQDVLRTQSGLSQQESLLHVDGSRITVTSTKLPLVDATTHRCIGVVNLCTNIVSDIGLVTDGQEDSERRQKIFDSFRGIARSIPIPFFWSDIHCRYIGVNQALADSAHELGYDAPPVGKTPYEFHPEKIADAIVNNQRQVMKEGRVLSFEEAVYSPLKKRNAYFRATISPIFDRNDIIGTYCVSVDITDHKEAEQLRLENQIKQVQLEQQKQFKRIVSQAVHDIRSPLTCIMMIIKAYADMMPEKPRTALNQATSSINTIADNLMAHWSTDVHSMAGTPTQGIEDEEILLVTLTLLQVLSSKQFEYKQLPIIFRHIFPPNSHFVCIKGNTNDFKRMVSNIINNAVSAYDGNAGEIICSLDVEHEKKHVTIGISDHGKGMSPEVLHNIRQNLSLTSGKTDGHGIGLTQARDMIERLNGDWMVNSALGEGTTFQLSFPQSQGLDWLADHLTINADDILLILDDEDFIHHAWDARFSQSELRHYVDQGRVRHFTEGQKTIDYIKQANNKERLFLLADYELLGQPINGLQVVEQTGLQRAMLVTGYYDDAYLQDYAHKTGIKILPKQLAAEVPINVHMTPHH